MAWRSFGYEASPSRCAQDFPAVEGRNSRILDLEGRLIVFGGSSMVQWLDFRGLQGRVGADATVQPVALPSSEYLRA